MTAPAPARHTIDLHGLTHGGEAVGRLPDGKACFVPYAIPGERVVIDVIEERRRWARGRLVEVVDASADRVDAPCPYFGQDDDGTPRCGGCALQHVAPERQAIMKQRVVREQLERIGGLVDPPVAETVTPAPFGYRTTARFAVDDDGRLGFRRLRSNEVIPVDTCILLTSETQGVRDEARDGWAGVEEVTVRAGDRGRVLVVAPGPGAVPPLPAGDADVALLSAGGAAAPLRGTGVVRMRAAGLDYRVSPTSFFQAGQPGAEALIQLVREAAAVRPGESALDLYAGVGLFAKALAADGATVTAIETHPGAVADAEVNLAGLPAQVLREPVDAAVTRLVAEGRWHDVVVLDPPRAGAGPALAAALPQLEARAVIYVSCDPAALARDARALIDAGMVLERATPVDQFAQTAAIETVAVFRPAEAP
jgi:tRNA/tmRNA/rRNA uracil-C5-methylase (TrmA/RlmC/RlmD family)